jgi:pimeloyl-ACP methyl ester carboxylesterase
VIGFATTGQYITRVSAAAFLIPGFGSLEETTIELMPPATIELAQTVVEGAVRSADGTRIGFRKLGSGPALLFVHGSVSTHTDWMRVAKLLAPSYTCYALDRRGRSHSGNGHSPYSLDREYEDIEAVMTQTGPLAALIGHSYGAICTLGAALRTPVSKLVIYEPPLPVGGLVAGEYFETYARAVAEGDLDTALEIGLSHFTRLSEKAIAQLRASKAWPRLRILAASWTRELHVVDTLSPVIDHYAAITCPVLMLVGALSPEHPMQDASSALARTLPNTRVEAIPGQGHMAMRDAPDIVAGLIRNFLNS